VVDRAGSATTMSGARVSARKIAAQAARVERPHRIRGTQIERPTAGPRIDGLEIFEDQVVRVVFGRADFLHDDVLLARKLLGSKVGLVRMSAENRARADIGGEERP